MHRGSTTSRTFYGHNSPAGPALAPFDPGDGERLFMAWIDLSRRLMIGQGMEHGVLDASEVVDADTYEVQTSRLGPALAVFENQLYLAWVGGADGALNV